MRAESQIVPSRTHPLYVCMLSKLRNGEYEGARMMTDSRSVVLLGNCVESLLERQRRLLRKCRSGSSLGM
jgi:hypothetical protein